MPVRASLLVVFSSDVEVVFWPEEKVIEILGIDATGVVRRSGFSEKVFVQRDCKRGVSRSRQKGRLHSYVSPFPNMSVKSIFPEGNKDFDTKR